MVTDQRAGHNPVSGRLGRHRKRHLLRLTTSAPWAQLIGVFWFLFKTAAFLFFYIWVRATLPRIRYDQLMWFGWKIMLPALGRQSARDGPICILELVTQRLPACVSVERTVGVE